jgi:hypothetical protein
MIKRRGLGLFLLAGLVTGVVSVAYNLFVFKVVGIYPDFLAEGFGGWIFVKDFIFGFVMAWLFRRACVNINYHMGWGIFFFILYSLSAFLVFSIGDFFLMKSTKGLLVLLTLDGFVETFVCTIPVKLLSKDCFR